MIEKPLILNFFSWLLPRERYLLSLSQTSEHNPQKQLKNHLAINIFPSMKNTETRFDIFFGWENAFAERKGFEPSIHFWCIHTFQACAFDHSATSLVHHYQGAQETKKILLNKICAAIHSISPRNEVSKTVLNNFGETALPKRYISLVIAASVVMSLPFII